MRSLQLIAGPAVEPVTLDRAKQHLRIDVSDEDELIADYIAAARDQLENAYQLSFVTQTWNLFLDAFPGSWGPWPGGWAPPLWPVPFAAPAVIIPMQPVQSVISVSYVDTTGATVVVPSTVWFADTAGSRVGTKFGQVWPQVALQPLSGVVIQFKAGYGDLGSTVPMAIRQAMLLMVGHFYINREQVLLEQRIRPIDLPRGVQNLMDPFDWQVLVA